MANTKRHLSGRVQKDIPAVVLPSNITSAINLFQRAVEDLAFSGAAPVEDREKIELRYVRAKLRLRSLIKDVM